ncbi:MAG: peptide deformylase [Patescibacteria group bacterium]
MSKPLPLVTIPTPSLRERSVDVDPKNIGTPEFQTFLDDLIETMFVEDGVGIAASQVGRNIRVFIVKEKGKGIAYINPNVTPLTDLTEKSEEGCLSVPGTFGAKDRPYGIVKRASKAHVMSLSRHARRIEFDVQGFLAIVFQHEMDHLNGVLYIDKLETDV